MNSDELLAGEHAIGADITMTSRNWAAEVLHCVADYTDAGMYPRNVSAFDLGRALGRALTNCNEENAYKEVLRGIERYEECKRSLKN